MKRWMPVFAVVAALLLPGCLHVISTESRRQLEPSTGDAVLLGGLVIRSADSVSRGTLEVLPFRLDRRGYPYAVAAKAPVFLVEGDPAVAAGELFPGRFVTLVGRPAGERLVAGEAGRPDRQLPAFQVVELYLWDTPFLWGVQGHPNLYAPSYRPAAADDPFHANPYDASYAPYPYTPYWYRASGIH